MAAESDGFGPDGLITMTCENNARSSSIIQGRAKLWSLHFIVASPYLERHMVDDKD